MAAKVCPIRLDPDPFKQFNVSAGFRVGDLFFQAMCQMIYRECHLMPGLMSKQI